MNRIVTWIAIPVLIGCTINAADRPVITVPADRQKIGAPGDPWCRPEQPCYRIEAEGRVPKGTHPFFLVEPIAVSPRMWVQPRIHGIAADGTVTGTIYLGEEDHGAEEFYKIYLLACGNPDVFASRTTVVRVPKGCAVSSAVKVYRVR